MNLTRQQWPLGWTPQNDSINGSPEGLLRADGLKLNEFGVLSLCDSQQKINSSPFGGEVRQIFSKTINNTKYRYLALGNGQVLKGTNSFEEIISGGNFTHIGFSSVLGQNLICAGDKRLKDDGTAIRELGLKKPDEAPQKIDTTSTVIEIGPNFSDWTAEAGTIYDQIVNGEHVIGLYTQVFDDGSTLWGVAQNTQDYDLSTIGGIPATEDDIFSFWFSMTEPTVELRIEFILTSEGYFNQDSYVYIWKQPEGALFGRLGYGITLSIRRSDFIRQGTNPNLDWKDVKRVRITALYTTGGVYFKGLKFTSAFLIGKSYKYASMNVAQLSSYTAKSPLSDPSEIITPDGGKIKISVDSPGSGDDADSQINEIWIFRRSSTQTDVTPIGAAPVLDTWYRVGVLEYPDEGLEFTDSTSDEEALELNIKADPYLISVKEIKEEIIGIVGGYYDRVLYLTREYVYVSEILNPDSIDSRNTIRFEGGQISENLWITKTSLGVVLVGTTQDIFEISGTFINLPDGSIDLTVKALGLSYPPLGYEFDVFSNEIYYIAKDGLRAIAPGGISRLITSPHFDLLFTGKTRHGISGIQVLSKHTQWYPIAVTQNFIFISLPLLDGNRYTFVLDKNTNSWQLRLTDPISFCVEEDGTILAGYGNDNGQYLREFNSGSKQDGSTGQTIRLLTIQDCNSQPRNRKDPFTFKISADTGNVPIQIWVKPDDYDFVFLGSYSFNGFQEIFIKLADVIRTAKYYQLKIECYTSLEKFYLYNFSIEYDPFPEQLNFLRIPNNNLGSYSRKRITNYAFVIETFGIPVIFTPFLDGTGFPTSNCSTSGKRTFIYYFKTEAIGTDIGGTLDGGPFEYYGLNLEEIISEKLPVPVKFLIIPNTDYGEPNRKRHSSYKFQINTKGYQVRFTPRLDGIDKAPINFSTNEKLTIEYFFSVDTIAIDIGGTLESLEDEEFEFYGVIKPQQVEVLPPRLKEFRIPENNYGIAARKRIRTLPMEINTNGYNVNFVPIVDGISLTPSVLNSTSRKTLLHYFDTDIFGVDFSGELIGSEPFEFYGLLKPEEVEILPVGKKLDQIGPFRTDKVGKLLALRLRTITEEVTLPFKIISENEVVLPNYGSANGVYSGTIVTNVGKDDVYELNIPKTIRGTVWRVVLGPTSLPFYNYDLQLKVALSGMEADPRWLRMINPGVKSG